MPAILHASLRKKAALEGLQLCLRSCMLTTFSSTPTAGWGFVGRRAVSAQGLRVLRRLEGGGFSEAARREGGTECGVECGASVEL